MYIYFLKFQTYVFGWKDEQYIGRMFKFLQAYVVPQGLKKKKFG